MSFQSRSEYIESQASEKLTLAWVEGVERLYTWSLHSGSIYKRVTNHYVVGLTDGTTTLTEVSELGSVAAGKWFYDHTTSTVYAQLTGGSGNPQTDGEMIVKYRFFYSNVGITATHDLTNTGNHVHYEGRIQSSPGYKHKIGIEQDLVSLIGGGTLILINTDGELDEIFDTIIYDNKNVTIHSWNRDLSYGASRIIFRGLITDKKFDSDSVSYVVKDQLSALEQNVEQSLYADVERYLIGDGGGSRLRRRVYGKVDGLKVQSESQTSRGISIGLVSNDGNNSMIYSAELGTHYLVHCSPGDKLSIGTQEFTINSVESDSILTINDTPEFPFTSTEAILYPESGYNIESNRWFTVADHFCALSTTTITKAVQFNRIQVEDTTGFYPGDIINIGLTDTVEVKNIAPNNILVLTKNLSSIPAVGTQVWRNFIQRVYHGSREIPYSMYISNNYIDAASLRILDTAEFQMARAKNLPIELSFTNGSRVVTYSGTNDLTELLKSRDWLRPADLSYSEYFEILSVGEGYALSGTVSGEIGQTTITGTDTFFLTELNPGDSFSIGGNSFVIDSITNNTTLILNAALEYTITDAAIRFEDVNSIELRTPFTEPTHVGLVQVKSPDYITDDSVISVNTYGKTEDGTETGVWIQNASQCIRDLLNDAGIDNINEDSFTQGESDNKELISLTIPLTPEGGPTKIKDVIDLLTKSTTSCLTLDNDLNLKFKVLNVEIPDNLTIIRDSDVIRWSINTTNAKNIRNTIVRYRHKDVDRFTLEPITLIKSYTSEFVQKYVGTNKTKDVDVYLYDSVSAEIMSHRVAYYNSLGRSDITIDTDLRLENLEIGDVVGVDFARMYKRFGDSGTRLKVLTIVGKEINGESTRLYLSDLGNVFNRSSVIAPNTANDYTNSNEEERLKYGYITEANGIVDDNEETDNLNLIS